MRRAFILLILLGLCAPVCARWDGYVTLGYRRDYLDWTIGVNQINILSELQWKQMNGVEARSQIENFFCNGLWLGLDACVAYLWNGRDQDSDFGLSDRQAEFSRSHSDVRGAVADLQLGLGFYRYCRSQMLVIPTVGLGYHTIYVESSRGRQVVPFEAPFLDQGVNATYNAWWLTAFLGTDARWCASSRWNWRGWFQFHIGQYIGVGDWRLRTDLDDFTHFAPGFGVVTGLQVEYQLCCNIYAIAAVGGEWWWSGSGVDTIHFSDGTRGSGRFNGAHWTTYGGRLGFLCYY